MNIFHSPPDFAGTFKNNRKINHFWAGTEHEESQNGVGVKMEWLPLITAALCPPVTEVEGE